MELQPSLAYVPPQTFKAQLHMLSQVPTQDTQLESLIDHHSVEDGLDHLRNAEIPCSFLNHSKVEVWTMFVAIYESS